MALFGIRRRSKATRTAAPPLTAPTTPSPATIPTTTTTTAAATLHYPEAIPCYNYYDIFPEDAGPMGHVVIDDRAEMRVWRLIAQPITPEEALKKGGCIQYVPLSDETNPKYYEFTHDAEVVYGRASYQKVVPESPVIGDYVVTKPFPASKHVDANTSYGGLSDEGLTDVQTRIG